MDPTAALESLMRLELAKWRRLKERRRSFKKKMLTCLGQNSLPIKRYGKAATIVAVVEESNNK